MQMFDNVSIYNESGSEICTYAEKIRSAAEAALVPSAREEVLAAWRSGGAKQSEADAESGACRACNKCCFCCSGCLRCVARARALALFGSVVFVVYDLCKCPPPPNAC